MHVHQVWQRGSLTDVQMEWQCREMKKLRRRRRKKRKRRKKKKKSQI